MPKFLTSLAMALAAILTLAPTAPAQVDGNYVLQRQGMSGKLTVRQLTGGEVQFKVNTVSKPSQHTAEIEGKVKIENNVGVYTGEEGCRLVFKFYPEMKKVVLSGGDETCRYYMGAAGWVDGTYVKK